MPKWFVCQGKLFVTCRANTTHDAVSIQLNFISFYNHIYNAYHKGVVLLLISYRSILVIWKTRTRTRGHGQRGHGHADTDTDTRTRTRGHGHADTDNMGTRTRTRGHGHADTDTRTRTRGHGQRGHGHADTDTRTRTRTTRTRTRGHGHSFSPFHCKVVKRKMIIFPVNVDFAIRLCLNNSLQIATYVNYCFWFQITS